MTGAEPIVDGDLFAEVYEVVRKVQVNETDGARPLDLQGLEHELNEALPGFTIAGAGLANQRLVTLAEIFQAVYPDEDKQEIKREVKDHLKQLLEAEKSEAFENFLPRETYIEFRKALLELLYQNMLSKEDQQSPRSVRKKLLRGDLEIMQIRNQQELWQDILDMFEADVDLTDAHAFRKIDRDRTGKVCAYELLRAFIPNVPTARIKEAMQHYEPAWREVKKGVIKQCAASYEMDMSGDWEDEEEEDGGEENPLLVVDEETFTFCKDVFEAIDLDQSGEITRKELLVYLEENESPFWTRVDWKTLDRNRDGYCSFLEFLRCMYPDEPAWKVKQDIATLKNVYGLEYYVKPKRRRSKLQRSGSISPGTKELSPLLRVRGLTDICAQRGNMFDTKIKELERKFLDADRDSKRFERERKSGHPILKYKIMTQDEQNALNQKLYYHQVDRIMSKEQQRKDDHAKPPSGGRWINENKLAEEDMEELNDRLYAGPLATRAENRQTLLDNTLVDLVPQRCINEDDLTTSVSRLYTGDLQFRKDRLQMLESKYFTSPRSRVMSPQATAACGDRLYTTGRKRKAEKHEALFKQYIVAKQLPKVKLGKEQQGAMIERLFITKTA